MQPLRGSGWLLKAKSNTGNDAELSSPAGTAPWEGQYPLELFPSPHGLLSPSGWSRVKRTWWDRSGLNHTPAHSGEANEAGSKFLSARGRNRYVKRLFFFSSSFTVISVSFAFSTLTYLVSLCSSKHHSAGHVHTRGRKTRFRGGAFDRNRLTRTPRAHESGGSRGAILPGKTCASKTLGTHRSSPNRLVPLGKSRRQQ